MWLTDFANLILVQLMGNRSEFQFRQAIVAGVIGTFHALGCRVVAEGIETAAELEQMRRMGVDLIQGYLLARPELEALPEPDLSYC